VHSRWGGIIEVRFLFAQQRARLMAKLNENDDARYLEKSMPLASNDPDLQRAGKAIGLFAAGLQQIPRYEWKDIFPNDFSAIACMARAFRQLRAAYMLALWGYCAEAHPLLRFVYETCGLARMLAKDSDKAEKWLRENKWFPDREVRKWFADSGPNSTASSRDEVLDTYRSGYKEMSARSHPTAVACVPALEVNEDGFEPRLATVFVDEEFRTCMAEIAATAIFACFTLRNAAVNESVLHPKWRQDVYELSREIMNSDMPHLARDWAEEQRQYDQLQQRVQSAARLDETLRRDPRSWDNLRKPSSPAE
jgi:hypothetical protein